LTDQPNEDFLKGYEYGWKESQEEFEERGFMIGVKSEQERIQSVLNMHIQWALESHDRIRASILADVKKDIVTFFTKESFDD
jgi:hypothetical protein